MNEGHDDYRARAIADPQISGGGHAPGPTPQPALSWRPDRPPTDTRLPPGIRAARLLLWGVRIPAVLVLLTDIVVVAAVEIGILSLDLPRKPAGHALTLMAAVVDAPGAPYAAMPSWGYSQVEPWATVFFVAIMLAIVITTDVLLARLVASARRLGLFALGGAALLVYGITLIIPNPLWFEVFRGSDAADYEIAPGQPAYVTLRAILLGCVVACQFGALVAAGLPMESRALQGNSAPPEKRPIGAIVAAIASFVLGLAALGWMVLNFAAVRGLRPHGRRFGTPFDLYHADKQAEAIIFAIALVPLAALAWWTAHTCWRGGRSPTAPLVTSVLAVSLTVSLLLAHLVKFPVDVHRRNAWAADVASWYPSTSATLFQILPLVALVIVICLARRRTRRWILAPLPSDSAP